MSPSRQAWIGLSLAAAITAAFVALHVLGVFFVRLETPLAWAGAPLMVATQSWLGAGLFIVAHDAMHGSLAPGRRRLEAAVGQAALAIYAGFPYRRLERAHHAHHRHAGGEGDPDFHTHDPRAFWPWYLGFMQEYFGWAQFCTLGGVGAVYILALHAHLLNVALFWATPALLSSLQLFTFGTWLPHRHEARGPRFADRHNARSLEYGWLASLLACFHFGYHLEHHLAPGTPWWRLPAYRRERAARGRPEAAFTSR